MITLNQQSVNVDRLKCILAITSGKVKHGVQWAEAQRDFEEASRLFLEQVNARADKGDYSNVQSNLVAPVNREQQYQDIIDMLGVSVDTVINIDMASYKAYYKNEWPWTKSFLEAAALAKTMVGSLRG